MKKLIILTLGVIVVLSIGFGQQEKQVPETLLPFSLLQEIINEVSGDLALQNEILLTGVNRNITPEEYVKGHFETKFILEKLKEYGINDAEIIELPKREEKTWDAEMAELWIVEPEKRKIADLREIAASLCEGSSSSDTTAELVYVGPGSKEEFFKGKKVKGKIVLVNGWPGGAQRIAVDKYGALGVVAYSSSHPEFDPDEVGWGGIEAKKNSFGFMISTRLGTELRDSLERGQKIVVRAVCKARMVPYKEEMVSALLKGKDYPQEELVFTAHLFEGFAKQGANDDVSGCTAILETARTLKKLQDDGKISPLKRSIRFLFVPEITGTSAYIKKFPEIAKRFFANINHDMVGEAIIKNQSYFCLVTTPYSLPTYLNDTMASFVEWIGKTQRQDFEYGDVPLAPIVSPTGTRDPFYYAIDRYSGGSDHVVFVDGGVRVPGVLLIVWPDMWYHTSGDLPDKSDSTQFKRVAFLSVAAGLFLANAGSAEAEKMMAETSARGLGRIGVEKTKAARLIQNADAKGLAVALKEARNVLNQAISREKDALSSAGFFVKSDAGLEKALAARLARVEDLRQSFLKEIEESYELRCSRDKVQPQKLEPSKDEIRLGGLVPVRTKSMGDIMAFWQMRDKISQMKYKMPASIRAAEFELRNFIDGKRTIAEIRDAASAEYEPLPLADVENYMKFLEKLGMVEIKKR